MIDFSKYLNDRRAVLSKNFPTIILTVLCTILLSGCTDFSNRTPRAKVDKLGSLTGIDTHKGLFVKSDGIDFYFYQDAMPTTEEKLAGAHASLIWNQTKGNKSKLADAIVRGKALIGKTDEQVREIMGEYDFGFGIYIYSGGGSLCELALKFEHDKVVDSYLRINY